MINLLDVKESLLYKLRDSMKYEKQIYLCSGSSTRSDMTCSPITVMASCMLYDTSLLIDRGIKELNFFPIDYASYRHMYRYYYSMSLIPMVVLDLVTMLKELDIDVVGLSMKRTFSGSITYLRTVLNSFEGLSWKVVDYEKKDSYIIIKKIK